MANQNFEQALSVGRPPNIRKLFPNSKALIVSGKVIDQAMLRKGKCMTIAANGRNIFVIEGTLRAAQKADAAVIIEIAKSESTYCPTTMFNIARRVDALMNQYGITVPVAIHADHYFIKGEPDYKQALTEIPALFDSGITSIAIDASHLPDADNLKTNIDLAPLIPTWAGYETEVGEIKGTQGLSTPEEALFLIRGLNAHGFFPDWIALNNGTTHGIEATGAGIQVDLTRDIHEALAPYGTSGAQHGTSGNDSDRLRQIAEKTRTTKANVATALQMIAWGIKVNDYGNAIMEDGRFAKLEGRGLSEELYAEIQAHADEHDIQGGNWKKLNLPFERRMLGQTADVRERMAQAVEDFVYDLLINVFNAKGTASLAMDMILEKNSHDMGVKADAFEDRAEWTEEKYRARADAMDVDKGPEGDFDD
ncbi:Fructose/tagatose bisphosphate aldolase [Paucidesulfovibrio gracilis DSM 16080]|uniref:Fructose/tagatose bisphosphate aldolase n=1 Tax=Paucidesulfovibrio gracilis DSM 16080 TaxID=1121449 RepID=A0A1T4Y424_9BACT|nr:class II fructose-bisphosphate aldolase [Paucidesulfovibrio gracilis]SKA96567.1 Fructose/tagatose bisphosphate aldolase [Paucidesulfovibrio gracilis DSM 16080]